MTSDDPTTELSNAWPETLSAADAMFLKGDGEPRTRGTGHLIYLLDSVPEWDRFVAVWDRASRILPPLHKRVVKPSVPGLLPVWRDDPDFDLRFHLRRLAVPAPGTLREVLDYAEADGMEPHDPGRPLWQVTLLEGLDGDRAAVLLKFHHSWMDGNANIQLARILYDTERGGDLSKPVPDPVDGRDSPSRPSPLESLARAPLTAARLWWSVASGVGRLVKRVALDPRGAIREGAELVASAQRLMNLSPAAPSPLLRGRSPRSRFDVLDVPFADLRQATKAVGCTLNDAYLAGVAGGFGRYHEHFGVHVDEIPIGMPISTRAEGDQALGNQVAATMLAAPIGKADPVERLKRFHELVLAARHEPAMDLLSGSVNILVHLPDALMAGPLMQLVKIDVGVSQVRGLLEPRYLAGAQLMRNYGFGPHVGLAAFIGMMTHLDTCCIGVHSDPAAVTDPDLFMQCLRRSFDEVIAVGHKPSAGRSAARPAARA